jgi:hypothetical protein
MYSKPDKARPKLPDAKVKLDIKVDSDQKFSFAEKSNIFLKAHHEYQHSLRDSREQNILSSENSRIPTIRRKIVFAQVQHYRGEIELSFHTQARVRRSSKILKQVGHLYRVKCQAQ